MSLSSISVMILPMLKFEKSFLLSLTIQFKFTLRVWLLFKIPVDDTAVVEIVESASYRPLLHTHLASSMLTNIAVFFQATLLLHGRCASGEPSERVRAAKALLLASLRPGQSPSIKNACFNTGEKLWSFWKLCIQILSTYLWTLYTHSNTQKLAHSLTHSPIPSVPSLRITSG